MIVMVSHVSGRWAFLDDDASHFQFVMTDTAEGGKSMGVLNEGHDTPLLCVHSYVGTSFSCKPDQLVRL